MESKKASEGTKMKMKIVRATVKEVKKIIWKHENGIHVSDLVLLYVVISLSILYLFDIFIIFFVLDLTVFISFLSQLLHKILITFGKIVTLYEHFRSGVAFRN